MCEAGRAQGSSGAFECKECTRGFFAADVGQTSCTACEAGRVSADAGSSSCTDCEAGKAQGATGQESCTECSENTYSAPKALACSECSLTRSAEAGSSSCDRCKEDFFYLRDGSSAGADGWGIPAAETATECSACPSGATCNGALFSPVPNEGFWMDRREGKPTFSE